LQIQQSPQAVFTSFKLKKNDHLPVSVNDTNNNSNSDRTEEKIDISKLYKSKQEDLREFIYNNLPLNARYFDKSDFCYESCKLHKVNAVETGQSRA
jgi:flagellar biosynthesis protein FliP